MKSKSCLLVAIFAATTAMGSAWAQSSSAGSAGASGGSYGAEDVSQPGYQGAEQTSTPAAIGLEPMQGDAYQAFVRLDSDNDGALKQEDVGNIRNFKFDFADRNKDGSLTADEFKRAWVSPDADTYKHGM